MRADARENRRRVVAAARELFAERGLDVPMATIARRAGVGVATLYRRFPTRADLVVEVFSDQLGVCVQAIDDALADPDPWHGFVSAVEKICAAQVVDRGFTAAFLSEFPDAVDYERERVRAERVFALVAQRAKDSGDLHPDFDRTDLTLLIMANGGITAPTPEAALAASRRLTTLLLTAFHLPTTPLPPPAPLGLYHTPLGPGR
ncbi:helix-turn-helix domain-containing protein [Actinocorallia sp. A-T 12471]|uniref:TetR/AcrR family transcriptional regulator n=1 Tax=Actinocorallia sp. A-T 12471 TaxID=3089813 RepID=UPI0029CF2CE6|nr:helix-turn-helix domain-containing protein [Actinocorallia sp. A-T 12471]MDX6744690.1 helix-turn-helix domain-containing protein [Actinocorallia sp. A-T 12471]